MSGLRRTEDSRLVVDAIGLGGDRSTCRSGKAKPKKAVVPQASSFYIPYALCCTLGMSTDSVWNHKSLSLEHRNERHAFLRD
jgi:hypothetical protein